MQNFATVCVDANIIVDGLRGAGSEQSSLSDLWHSFYSNHTTFVQPTLFCAEITSVFRSLEFAREITSEEARRFLETAFRLPITWLEDDSIHFEALEIARAFGVRAAYDAHYVAVARRASIPLVTGDRRLANAASQFVEVVYLPRDVS